MATALGYSPQVAAFHHIAHAVGHHVLQHYSLFDGVYRDKQSRVDLVLHTELARFDTEFYPFSPEDEQLKNVLIGGKLRPFIVQRMF